MILGKTTIDGIFTIDIEAQSDERGTFARTFDADLLASAGLVHVFAYHSIASNALRGTIRGMHFQSGEHAESKIVRCTKGTIFDVAVDLRPKSATYGRYVGVELSANNHRALYIPAGCAHGYQTLEDDTEALYLIDVAYAPQAANGLHHADPVVAIRWPLAVASISKKDASLPQLPPKT